MSNIEKLVNIAYKPHLTSTLTASGTVEAGLAVTYAGAVAASGVACHGIAEQDATSGNDFTLVVVGEAPAIAGGTITVGQPLTPNGTGKIVPAQTGDVVLARSLQAATINQAFKLVITQEGKLPS